MARLKFTPLAGGVAWFDTASCPWSHTGKPFAGRRPMGWAGMKPTGETITPMLFQTVDGRFIRGRAETAVVDQVPGRGFPWGKELPTAAAAEWADQNGGELPGPPVPPADPVPVADPRNAEIYAAWAARPKEKLETIGTRFDLTEGSIRRIVKQYAQSQTPQLSYERQQKRRPKRPKRSKRLS